MSRFFPHTPYAEDQPLPYVILTTHVMTRGITAGAIAGLGIASVRHAIPAYRGARPFPERLLVTSSKSIVVASAVTAVALVGRMWGRQPIEWSDRSWRLMENRGQLETDDWTYGGMALAAAAVALRGSAGPAKLGWQGLTGAVGLGSIAGMTGYLGWRYGINGGKFVQKNTKEEKPI